jgi:predicted nucleotide-binding protein (sugar kinase/HSP70/actin superfamily)
VRLKWKPRTSAQDSIEAAKGYIRPQIYGEAILTLGAPLHEHALGEIHGVVNMGPLECMPSKVDEAQFHHAAGERDLPALTIYVNGDPVDPELLDSFAYEVKQRFYSSKR